MKFKGFTFVSLLIVSTMSLPVWPAESLPQVLKEFDLAFQQADVNTLTSRLTDDYLHTNSGSKAFGKEGWLNWIAGRQGAVQSGELSYQDYLIRDLDIRYYGQSAVVTGRATAKGMNKGESFTVDIRFTHLWVNEQGRWRRAAFHDAPAKE